jgi:hypothetical protein
VRWVDKLRWMIWLICAWRGRVVCRIVRRVWVVWVVVYWSSRGRGEVVRFREETRVVRMGSGWRGTIIGAVGASGVG